MKRFLIFAGVNFYPSGGIDDLIGKADTLAEAQTILPKRMIPEGFESMSWGHIYDCENDEVLDRVGQLNTNEKS